MKKLISKLRNYAFKRKSPSEILINDIAEYINKNILNICVSKIFVGEGFNFEVEVSKGKSWITAVANENHGTCYIILNSLRCKFNNRKYSALLTKNDVISQYKLVIATRKQVKWRR